jgi:hypothetical protein
VLDAVEKRELYMREELDLSLQQLGWTRNDLIGALSDTGFTAFNGNDHTFHLELARNATITTA